MKLLTRFAAFLLLTCFVFQQSASADLTITLSENTADGSTNIEFNGTGDLVSAGNFSYDAAAGVDFVSGSVVGTFGSTTPTIAGGSTFNTISFNNAFGAFLPENVTFGDPGWVVGQPLNTANGQVFNLSDLLFSNFIVGTYSLTPSPFDDGDVVGAAQLIIVETSAVPEPSSMLALGVIGLGILVRRRQA